MVMDTAIVTRHKEVSLAALATPPRVKLSPDPTLRLPIFERVYRRNGSPSPSSSSQTSMEDLEDAEMTDVVRDPFLEIMPDITSKVQNGDCSSHCDDAVVMWLFGRLKHNLGELAVENGFRFFVSPGFLERLAHDMVRMCLQEPGGATGSIIKVFLNRGSETLMLGKIPLTNRPPMLEINLHLTAKSKTWSSLGDLVQIFQNSAVYLSSSFTFEKTKLFRINSLTGSITE